MKNSKHGISQEMKGWLKLVFLLLFQVIDCHILDISKQWNYIIQFFKRKQLLHPIFMTCKFSISSYSAVLSVHVSCSEMKLCKRPNSFIPQLDECTYCSQATQRKQNLQKSWSYHCFSGLDSPYSSHTQNQYSILLHISHGFLLAFDVHSCMYYV